MTRAEMLELLRDRAAPPLQVDMVRGPYRDWALTERRFVGALATSSADDLDVLLDLAQLLLEMRARFEHHAACRASIDHALSLRAEGRTWRMWSGELDLVDNPGARY